MDNIQHKIYLFLIIIISILQSACSNNAQPDLENKQLENHLPANLVSNPRSLHDDTAALNKMGRLVFKDTLHDFGRIREGEKVQFEFEFVNEGKESIIISDAKASCGCTVPSFPKYPILSEQKDKISVTFNSEGKYGYNEKLMIISTNGNPPVYQLYIRAEVVRK